jgi:hypothetical protein
MESSATSAAAASAASNAVSSAVRSLNSLSDFTLDVSNGNYDSYSVTDSLLSGKASVEKDGGSHPQPPGALLDFKSPLGDMENKTGADLR